MKKSLKIILTVILVIFASLFAISCKTNESAHEHTYGLSYTYDKTHHWYAATCEHENEYYGKGEHTYNGDFVCTVCKYKHVHSYVTEYAYDDTHHWFPANCGHNDFKSNVIKHVYDANYICLFCGYSHEHRMVGGSCSCGYTDGSVTPIVTNLVGNTFYLQSAVFNEGDGKGDILYTPADEGFSKDFYNLTFTEEGKGYANMAMPIDKELTYELDGESLTVNIFRDTAQQSNFILSYVQEVAVYTGSFKGGRIVLNYDFTTASGISKSRVYIFTPGEKLTNDYFVYNDLVGKTFSNQVQGQKLNYREVTVKEGNVCDVTFYNYTDGVAVPDKYTDCVSIFTSTNKDGVYHYVLRCYVGLTGYDIKFTVDGVIVDFKQVV